MTLTHHQLPARSGRTRSLVILLHGFGSNGASILGLGQTLSAHLPDTAFLAPDGPDPVPGRANRRMWYTIPELGGSTPEEADLRLQASARKLDAFLDDQLAAHGLPASAMALLGFSQGAGMTYEVAPRRRDQLAGVVAIAGRMKRKDTLAAEARSKPPFLILTGAEDRLLTTEETSETANTLSAANIPAIRHLMAGKGHAISDEGITAIAEFLGAVLHRTDAKAPGCVD